MVLCEVMAYPFALISVKGLFKKKCEDGPSKGKQHEHCVTDNDGGDMGDYVDDDDDGMEGDENNTVSTRAGPLTLRSL